MESASNASSRSIGGGESVPVPATRRFLECSALECRARGPAKRTVAEALAAFTVANVPIPFTQE